MSELGRELTNETDLFAIMNQPASRILLVGCDPQWAGKLSSLLSADSVASVQAQSAEEALQLLHQHPIDLVLADFELPAGPDLLQRIKDHPPSSITLLIALVDADDTAAKLRAFELGALDCINKQTEPALLRARLLAALKMRHRQDELIRSNKELIEARRIAESSVRAKSDFLAAMSHEIRTPMNGVIAMVGLLHGNATDADQRGYLETIQTSGESLLTIINDILDFSKIEAGKMELDSRPFDLRTRIEETLDLLSAKAVEKNLDLVYQVDALHSGDPRGRFAPAAAGAGESLEQRHQVHRKGRNLCPGRIAFDADGGSARPFGAAPAFFRARHRHRHHSRKSWRGCSSRSCRPRNPPRGITAARGWDWPSASGSSK